MPIWIVYQSKFLSYSQIAFYSGLSLIIEVISQLPTGAFADIIGRKYALSLGNLFMALAMFLIAFFPSPWIMPIYAIMWGLGRAFSMGTSKPILYDTLASQNKVSLYPQILSKSILFFQFSAAISIILGGYLYQYRSNLPYIISGLTSLIGVFTSFIFVESQMAREPSKLRKFISTSTRGFAEIFKNSYVAKLTLLYALTLGIALTSQQFLSQPYMLEIGMNDIARSWTAMIIKISIALLGAKLVASSKIVDHKYYLVIIPLIMTLTFIPAGVTGLPWAYLILIGIAFNSGNTELFFSAEINKHLSSSVRSTAISIQRMFASTFGVIVQWLSIAVVAQHTIGTYYVYLGIFVLVIIVPLALSLSTHKHRYNQDVTITPWSNVEK
jgi:MFS family permease